jgi:hypothetical protein
MDLKRLAQLAKDLIKADDTVADLEAKLKDATERARIIREETIPNFMLADEIKEVVLDSGERLKIDQEIYCQIPANGREKAYKWLEAHGHGGLIKTEVTVAFGKGELKKAAVFTAACLKKRLDAALDQNVHASTMKAFIKEQIRNRKKIPLATFGARPVWTTKIIAAKKH